MAKLLSVCRVEDVEPGEMFRVESQPAIAIYRVEDEFFATAATCTHMESCLTEGYLDDDVVECALHAATFCVRNGKAMSLPATVSLRTFDVQVKDGEVLLELPEDVEAPT